MEKLLVKEVVAPVIIIVVGVCIYYLFKNMITRIFNKRISKYHNNRYKTLTSLFRNIIKYFIIIICSIMILDIYGIDTKSILTSLGVVGVISGLALQDFLKDFIAGLTILIENQYAIGDLVSIDGFKGNVTVFTLKTTRIKAWTGEEKIIANHLVTDVINFNHHNSLAVVDVGVGYEEDLDHVYDVLNSLCVKMSKELPHLKGNVTVLGVDDLASSAVVFKLSAEVKSGEQYSIQRTMKKMIKDELDKQKINIPYNQLVIHNAK